MRLYTVLLRFLQTALRISDDTFIHHHEHIQTVITIVTSCWTIIDTDSRCMDPWT